jgi:hypothetical protein
MTITIAIPSEPIAIPVRTKMYVPNRSNGEMLLQVGVKYPCMLCRCTMNVSYEPAAKSFVCASCYNDYAEDYGWEKPKR